MRRSRITGNSQHMDMALAVNQNHIMLDGLLYMYLIHTHL